jgi:lysylphosphatidylglycerol synthetase-like protein (DUF2156 family)
MGACPGASAIRSLPRAALRVVRAHGSDSLAFFKLRLDKHYLFTADRHAFLGYRVLRGMLLVSGDLRDRRRPSPSSWAR